MAPGAIAAGGEQPLHVPDERRGVGRLHLRPGGRLRRRGDAEHQMLQEGLGRLAGQRQAVLVLEGHDRPRAPRGRMMPSAISGP